MPRTKKRTKPASSVADTAASLPKLALFAIFLCCSGCLRHKIPIADGYRIEENAGAPMLVPIDGHRSSPAEFQTSKIVLPGGAAGAGHEPGRKCVLQGQAFSLHSASPRDRSQWTVRSPSISGWNTLAGRLNLDAQWDAFTRGLARLNENGCFPAHLTALEIRTAIAQRIPLPASEVPLFFYSQQRLGFIDLAPGMEISLQQFLPAVKPIGTRSQNTSRKWAANDWSADYEVIPRHGAGVRLKLTRKVQRGPNLGSGVEEKRLFSLSPQFAQTPVLRLFLEGVYGKGEVSNGILIGASDQRQLDALTDLIHRSDPAKCMNYHGTLCTEFPRGSLSLFYTLRVNGHRTSCLFGTSLAALLRFRPRPEQRKALESARVFRRLIRGHYAEIEFPRTPAGAAQLLLLPGDRIQWKHESQR